MKILLTGLPGIGKSTLIDKVISAVPECLGILAHEQRKEEVRSGFIAENRQGEYKQFMHKIDKPSRNSIGSPGHLYEVDINVIDTFVVPELQKGLTADYSIVYIDEIGRAQMKSTVFINVVRDLLLKPGKNVLATIIYADDPGSPSLEFKKYPKIFLLEVNKKNRDMLPKILIAAFKNSDLFNKLNEKHQQKVFALLKQFIQNEQYISAEKIFTNALDYLVNNRFILLKEKGSIAEYVVYGKTRAHKVDYNRSSEIFNCDCELSSGTGCYAGCSQTCSHQIAVLLAATASAPMKGLFEFKQNKVQDNPSLTPVYRSRL